MLPGRGRGTKTGLADTGSKEKALAEKIMQELAKENLTISQVSFILQIAQTMIQDAKFTDFVPQE